MATNEFDDDPTRSFTNLVAGTRVSHYTIMSKIGAGGMGEVYLAHDTDLDRQVALKILPQKMCHDEGRRDQFRQEAQTVAKLNHPNIVQIYEVGEDRGRLFFAMEHVEGPPLATACSGAADSIQFAVNTGLAVCDALQAAHEAGIEHRDIKPSNILLGRDGRVKLADFGLAALEGTERLSKEGSTPGTVGYMSPEQVQSGVVDRRSDIFGLGVVLYELLAGSRPFTGDYEAAVQYAIVNDPVPPLRSVDLDIPEGLANTIERALAKNPDKRPQNADELKLMLTKSAGGTYDQFSRVTFTRSHLYWVVFVLILVVATSYLFLMQATQLDGPTRLAVLPFENIGPPDNEHLAVGITEVVISDLAGLKAVEVISSRSAIKLARAEKDSGEFGDWLNLDYYVEGTVRKSDVTGPAQLKINLRLLRLTDDTYIWSKEYNTSGTNLLEVQSEITNDLTRELSIIISEPEAGRLAMRSTVRPEAWELYVRGNGYFHRTWTLDDIAIAIRLYERAVAIDSNFALAWSMLSRGHSSMYWEYYDRSDERCTLAMRAAEKALQLQPDLAAGHEALGYCYYHCNRRLDAALSEFEAGLMFQPGNSNLHNAIAAVLRRQGRLDEAIESFKSAFRLDPQSDLKAFDIALTYGMMRQYDSANVFINQTVALEPEGILPYLFRAWLPIIARGDVEESRRALASASSRVEIYHSPFYWWLARMTSDDYEQQLSAARPGVDTAAYYINAARLYRLLGGESEVRVFADSAGTILTDRLRERPDDPHYLSQMSLVHAFRGNAEEGTEMGSRALQFLPASKEAFDAPFMIINFAEVLVLCGQHDAAVEQLQLLLSIPGFASTSYLELDPLWMPLRGNPAFETLVSDQ